MTQCVVKHASPATMSGLGFPVIGDPKYEENNARLRKGQALSRATIRA